MAFNLDSVLGVHQQALKLRTQRASVIANNLANADTPGYKARDIDFKAALNQSSGSSSGVSIKKSHPGHMGLSASDQHASAMYRTPNQPSIDGNTVEEQVEHAEYMKNSLDFQASFQFLNSKFKGITKAFKGE